MNKTVTCKAVRSAIHDDEPCALIIASAEEPKTRRDCEIADPVELARVAEVFKEQGIVLGASLPRRGNQTNANGAVRRPVDVVFRDDGGVERVMPAKAVEDYSLSSGSTLYFVYLADPIDELRQLVGNIIEIRDAAPALAGSGDDRSPQVA